MAFLRAALAVLLLAGVCHGKIAPVSGVSWVIRADWSMGKAG
jgi:hypothetical protein